MKKLLLLLGIVSIVSCDHLKQATSTNSTTTMDSTTAKNEIGIVQDSMDNAFKNGNPASIMAPLSDDGLYLGTDPGEYWTKSELNDYFKKAFAHDTTKINFTIDRRNILLSDDHNSAIVVQQFYLPPMSKKIMARTISHVTKKGEGWKIDFFSWNLIPKNEDIPKLNKALE